MLVVAGQSLQGSLSQCKCLDGMHASLLPNSSLLPEWSSSSQYTLSKWVWLVPVKKSGLPIFLVMEDLVARLVPYLKKTDVQELASIFIVASQLAMGIVVNLLELVHEVWVASWFVKNIILPLFFCIQILVQYTTIY